MTQAPYCKAQLVVPDNRFLCDMGGSTTGEPNLDSGSSALPEATRLCSLIFKSAAEFILISSAHVAIEATGWLERLLLSAQEPDVAAVCTTVLSPAGLVWHAGWVIGLDGEMRPAMRGFDPGSDGFAGSMSCVREISVCSADFVLLRRSSVVAHLPKNPPYVSSDYLIADLVFRMTQSRLRAICLPSVMAHCSAQSEPTSSANRIDGLIFQDIWAQSAAIGDPFYNPNFAPDRADYT